MSIPSSLTPLFNSGSSAAAAGYQVSRSLRFNAPDTAFLNRTPAVAGDRTKWTWAGWVKRSELGRTQMLFCGGPDTANDTDQIQTYFTSSDTFGINSQNSQFRITTQVFRDVSAWYHFVIAVDTTIASPANDRIKLYINGSQVTTFNVTANPTQNANTGINATTQHTFGRSSGAQYTSSAFSFSGYLAETYLIDGQALTPSSFTEVSATTGQLIPLAYSGSFGTNGFWLKFSDNSAATAATLGKDYSGNSNNWTPNNFSVTGILNYSSNVTTVATSVYSGTPATMFNGGTSIYYGVTSSSGNSSISIDLTGKGVSVSSSVRVYASFRTGQVWQINGSTVSSSGVTHPNTGWQTLSGWSAGAITSFSNSVPSGSANEIYAIEIDGVILTNNTGAGNDSLVDTPTSTGTDTGVGNEVRGNYATFNPLNKHNASDALSNGNLDLVAAGGSAGLAPSTIGVSSGKWYCEFVFTGGTANDLLAGIRRADSRNYDNSYLYRGNSNLVTNGSVGSNYGSGFVLNDVVGVAFDADNGKLFISVNGTFTGSGNPVTGANPAFSSITGTYNLIVGTYNNICNATVNFGQRAFAYTAPSGFKALCDTNLGAPLVALPNTLMDAVLYTGNGGTQTISSLAFSPDFVWIKPRSIAEQHELYNIISGPNKALFTDYTDGETTVTDGLNTFNSNGFSLGSRQYVNGSGQSYVAWTWDAGTSTVSNTAGSITSQVRANASAGFSVVTYTGNGTGGATFGHGLGVKPGFSICKKRTGSLDGWYILHSSLGATKYVALNSTSGATTYSGLWNNTEPTSTLFSLGVDFGSNQGGVNYISYQFAPVVGYSSFGSYTGNGSADGPFVFLGFRPRWLMYKVYSGDTGHWFIHDTSRDPYNEAKYFLRANLSTEETTSIFYPLDILSNGFKIRSNNGNINGSGYGFLYAAFAENPFQYSRAR